MKPHAMNTLLAATALAATLACGTAHAQFGQMLKNAVSNAVTNATANAAATATTNAVNGAVREVTAPAPRRQEAPQRQAAAPDVAGAVPAPAASSAPTPAPQAVVAGREGCESTRKRQPLPPLPPRPADFPAELWPQEPPCAYSFADYDFSAGKAHVAEFDKAGTVACSECVLGKSDDGNAHGKLASTGKLKKRFVELLATLEPGEKVEWKGARYLGTIVLAGERPIGDFPCRQFRWTLTNKAGDVMAERGGLFCIWQDRTSDAPEWHKVL